MLVKMFVEMLMDMLMEMLVDIGHTGDAGGCAIGSNSVIKYHAVSTDSVT